MAVNTVVCPLCTGVKLWQYVTVLPLILWYQINTTGASSPIALLIRSHSHRLSLCQPSLHVMSPIWALHTFLLDYFVKPQFKPLCFCVLTSNKLFKHKSTPPSGLLFIHLFFIFRGGLMKLIEPYHLQKSRDVNLRAPNRTLSSPGCALKPFPWKSQTGLVMGQPWWRLTPIGNMFVFQRKRTPGS